MRRSAALFLACLMLVGTGCFAAKRSQTPPAPAPGGDQLPGGSQNPGGTQGPGPAGAQSGPPGGIYVAPPPEGPPLGAYQSPDDIPPSRLGPSLARYMGQPGGNTDPITMLDELFSRWDLRPRTGQILHARADLDGDGTHEVITALNGASGARPIGRGIVAVLSPQKDHWTVSTSPLLPGVVLHAVADLTGDGRPEVVWSSTQMGAHTATASVHVSAWRPDKEVADLPGGRFDITGLEFEQDGTDLILNGGLIASAGAGELQRPRSDRYRWQKDEFRLVDRRFAPSALGYHRLVDAITAEQVGRTADALKAYREAMEPGRAAFGGNSVSPEWAQKAPDAVRAFARTRLALLLLQTGQSAEAERVAQGGTGAFAELPQSLPPFRDNVAACAKLEAYAQRVTDFLDALNSPDGYANPHWNEGDLCGPLPPVG